MSEPADEELKRIEEQLDDTTIERLALYTVTKLGRRYWQGVLGGQTPGGQEAMDFVEQAIHKTVLAARGEEGGRVWPRDKDLYSHLKSIIDSDIYHLVRGWENRHFRSEAALVKQTADGQIVSQFDLAAANCASPGEACESTEIETARQNALLEFIDFISDDQQLQKLMGLLIDGVTKSSDQAKRLSISEKEMYVVTRRMNRRVEDFRKKRKSTIEKVINA